LKGSFLAAETGLHLLDLPHRAGEARVGLRDILEQGLDQGSRVLAERLEIALLVESALQTLAGALHDPRIYIS